MANNLTLKVCVVGPKECGKTRLCRILGSGKDSNGYEPTEGVRIERVSRNVNGEEVNVQLWDASGDPKFQNTYPALANAMHALMVCYNPDNSSHIAELDRWITAFLGEKTFTSTSPVLLVALKQDPSSKQSDLKGVLKRLRHVTVNFPTKPGAVDETVNDIGSHLDGLISGALSAEREKQERRVLE